MAVNEPYTESADDVPDTDELIVDGDGAETGIVQITELGGTGDTIVYREVDDGQDGTFEVSDQIAGPGDAENPTEGEWHSQGNNLWVGDVGTDKTQRLRLVNVDGDDIDLYATGFEVGRDD